MNTVDRALRLIELIVHKPMMVGEIAEALDVHKSSASRLVQTLEAHKLLKNQNGFISPGYGILQWAYKIQESIDLRDIARPYIQNIAKITKGTIHLAVLDEHEVVYIDKIDSIYPVRMYSSIGKRSPVYCTGVGKAILAYLPDKQVREVLEKLEYKRFTKRTITSDEELLKELEKIRQQNLSIDNAEHEDEVRCIAAPIFNFERKVVAGMSVSITSSRSSLSELLSHKSLLLESAQAISTELGYT
ncbi:IclR family transcriptional regulator [Cohnella candidum]|uniref:IclR family transcriptional regulator n=1 Tax=Cohnella candidum TaxID=2674991 RepID=A0A3G3K433_9BACL|nr:IclR family transcriptional regulator [Cohnella candidum]AYQ74911.1 IclR family transcriptional regulator [Cohnella candidum]